MGQTGENPISVSVKKFNCTFNPLDTSVWEKEVIFQMYMSVFVHDKELLLI